MMDLHDRCNAAQRAFLADPSPERRSAFISAHAAFVRDFCPGEAEQLIAELAQRLEVRDAA